MDAKTKYGENEVLPAPNGLINPNACLHLAAFAQSLK